MLRDSRRGIERGGFVIDGRSVLALVTARGGSKGLPGKNVRPLCGKPLIAWTVAAGLESRIIDTLVVSTDDETIAEAARAAGARVPFMRPAELATDTATSMDVVEHAVQSLEEMGERFDYLVLLEPTSPLREASDIDNAMAELCRRNPEGSVVSVCAAETVHPAFMYRLDDRGRLTPYGGRQPDGLRRQEIDPVYYLDGTVYASWIPTLRQRRSFYHDATIPYVVPKWKAPEIDDLLDLVVVEAIMKHRMDS